MNGTGKGERVPTRISEERAAAIAGATEAIATAATAATILKRRRCTTTSRSTAPIEATPSALELTEIA